jgi:predicted lipid-binding transport protein (Tim44 family)
MEDAELAGNEVASVPAEMELDPAEHESQADSPAEAQSAEEDCSTLSHNAPLDESKQRIVDGFVSMIRQAQTPYQRQKATECKLI